MATPHAERTDRNTAIGDRSDRERTVDCAGDRRGPGSPAVHSLRKGRDQVQVSDVLRREVAAGDRIQAAIAVPQARKLARESKPFDKLRANGLGARPYENRPGRARTRRGAAPTGV